MLNLMIAFGRAFSSLLQPKMWPPLIAPVLISFLVWILLTIFTLHSLAGWLIDKPPFSWASAFVALWLGKLLAYIGGWALIFAAAYLSATMLAAIFVLPMLLKRTAASSYPDLALMGKDSFVAGAVNSVVAMLGFIAGWVATLPFWIIPGAGLLLPFLWLAWLNRRTFSYDVLCVHASDEEWQTLRQQHARPLFLLGLCFAVFAHIPVLGMLAPALAMLTYIHYGLEALRQLRGGAVLTVSKQEASGRARQASASSRAAGGGAANDAVNNTDTGDILKCDSCDAPSSSASASSSSSPRALKSSSRSDAPDTAAGSDSGDSD